MHLLPLTYGEHKKYRNPVSVLKCQNKNLMLIFRKIFANVGVSIQCASLFTCQTGRTSHKHSTLQIDWPHDGLMLCKALGREHLWPSRSQALRSTSKRCSLRLNNGTDLRGRQDLGLSCLSVSKMKSWKMSCGQFKYLQVFLRENTDIREA